VLFRSVGGNLSEIQLEFTGAMNVNVEKLLKLINELLDFSKIDSGTFSVDKRDSDLSIIARRAIIEMEPIAAKKNIKLVDLIKNASLPAVFDDTRIGQVIVNLLNNAVKYTYSGTNIYLSLEEISDPCSILPDYLKNASGPAGKYYLVSVRDEGPGMDPKYCRRIFDQFYQIEDANTRKHEGVGLGLNISMNIIKAHNGFIWAESKGKDTGAAFFFLLPVK
jgi:signal transduction histidine kinase